MTRGFVAGWKMNWPRLGVVLLAFSFAPDLAHAAGGTVTLNGATSGTVVIQVPAVAGSTTFQLPGDNGTNNYTLKTDGAGVTSWAAASAVSSLALSSLTAATTTNSIDSANYAQTWKWGTLSTQTALTLTSSSMTTGTLLSLSNSATGNNAGTVLSVSNSEANAASYGINVSSATTGSGYGIYSGLTAANTGYAVYATNAATGAGYGIYSSITGAGNTGRAAYFTNTSTTGANFGVYSVISSSDNNAVGIYGKYNAATGDGYGIQGVYASSGFGAGVAGLAAAANNGGMAGYFVNQGTSGANYGVWSEINSTDDSAIAILGRNLATTGNGTGVKGRTNSAGSGAGVYGLNAGTGNTGYAGYFTNTATTANYGVYATTASTGAGTGVYGSVTGASNTGYGVHAYNNSTSGWALYADGAAPSYFAGNVGIGSSAPFEFFDVAGSSKTISSTDAIELIRSTDSQAQDKGGSLAFGGEDGSTSRTFAVIAGFKENGTSGNYAAYLAFATRPNGGSPAERMRITSSGNVGIGSTSPNTNLDVNGFMEWSGQSRVSSTFSKTSSTALAAITGLSATLTAGKTYYFDIMLYTTSGTLGGIQADLNGGGATATALIGDAFSFDSAVVKTQTRFSALNTALCAVTAVTAANCHITGTITVNTGGTFIPRFAQNASNGTASTVAIGSIMIVNQIN